MTDWTAILRAGCPHGSPAILAGFAQELPDLTVKYSITTPLRQAHFLAQCCWESGHLTTTTELDSGREYDGRRDLGNTHPGDGPKFKGRGLIQNTGRANYAALGAKLGQNFLVNTPLLAQFPWAALAAGQYWHDRNINAAADRDDIVAVTKLVNGGKNGLAGREALLHPFKHALGA